MDKQITTLIGSFRKDRSKLEATFSELSKHFELLCPKSIDFIDHKADFVKAAHEIDDSVNVIEERVLEAIRKSDFVWLFAPSGYVGTSASFEMGLAYSLGVPIYTDTELQDEMLQTMVTEVVNSAAVVRTQVHKPGKGISGLQRYYQRISNRRGWANESPKDTMLLLTEEMGELARAIRKSEGLKRDAGYEDVGLQDELADVQLYLVHLANSLGIELDEAVTQKERKNHERHEKNKNK